jgi:hypothetical protein
MTEPEVHQNPEGQDPEAQDPEGISTRAIGVVAAGVVAISAGLVAIAWLLVAPVPAARPAAAASALERGLIENAAGGEQIRAAGAQRLERTEWVDRGAQIVRIPIDRAIDAVVADPRLIGTPPPGLAAASPEVRR